MRPLRVFSKILIQMFVRRYTAFMNDNSNVGDIEEGILKPYLRILDNRNWKHMEPTLLEMEDLTYALCI